MADGPKERAGPRRHDGDRFGPRVPHENVFGRIQRETGCVMMPEPRSFGGCVVGLCCCTSSAGGRSTTRWGGNHIGDRRAGLQALGVKRCELSLLDGSARRDMGNLHSRNLQNVSPPCSLKGMGTPLKTSKRWKGAALAQAARGLRRGLRLFFKRAKPETKPMRRYLAYFWHDLNAEVRGA